MRSTILAITVSMVAVTAHGQGTKHRLEALESDVDAIELEQAAQNGRLGTIESDQTTQNGRLDTLEAAPSGRSMVVVDGNGTELGHYLGFLPGTDNRLMMLFDTGTEWIALIYDENVGFGHGKFTLFFDEIDCTGAIHKLAEQGGTPFPVVAFNFNDYAVLPDGVTVTKMGQVRS